MALRAWTGPVVTAVGVAAGAGAAQLGFGYGLGVIVWSPATAGAGDAGWVASLAWATWIAATATIAGAVCANRLAVTRPHPPGPAPTSADRVDSRAFSPTTALQRGMLALAAGIGALVTVVLVAVPARTAERTDTLSPQMTAASYAAVGVLIGLLVALWALASPAIAGNVITTACWIWLLAVGVVVNGVLSGQGPAGAQLGTGQTTSDGAGLRIPGTWPEVLLTLGPALLIGIAAAGSGARRASARVGTTLSGAVGPALVATAYLLAAPRQAEQPWSHLTAPYAVLAGLAGSAVVAAYAQRADHRPRRVVPAAADPGPAHTGHPDTGTAGSVEPRNDAPAATEPGGEPRIPGQPTAGPDGGSVTSAGTNPDPEAEPKPKPKGEVEVASAAPRAPRKSSRSTRRSS